MGLAIWNTRPGAGAATSPSLLLKMAFLEPVKRHATSCFYFLSQRLQVSLGNCRCGIKSPGCQQQGGWHGTASVTSRPLLLGPHAFPTAPGFQQAPSQSVPKPMACASSFPSLSCKPSLRSSSLCSLAASLPACNPLVFISLPEHAQCLCFGQGQPAQ